MQRITMPNNILLPEVERLLHNGTTAPTAGRTMIFITHRQEIAHRCDEIIRLNK